MADKEARRNLRDVSAEDHFRKRHGRGWAYPVHGANGVIGRYDKFNHEEPQLLVTCRGAPCGSANISAPNSWGKALMVDYVLEYRNTKLAVVEAKAWDEALTEGVAQSKNSAGKLAICYTFSSSGQGIYGIVRPRRRRNVPRASTALDRPCPAGNPRGLGGIDDGAPASGGGKRAVRIAPQPRHPPRYAGHSGIYLSRYITTTKPDYYRLLQTVRDEDRWAEWCLYIIRGVAVTSRSAIGLVKAFRDLMLKTRHDLRERLPRLYSQDLLNNLFRYSYTKIEFIERELGVSRPTAAKYLEQLTLAGLVRKQKMGKTNFYISEQLFALLSNVTLSCKKSANWIIRFYQEIAVNRVLERLSGLAVASVLS